MSIQGWFPLRLTGLISMQSKGLSRVFSKTTIQTHQSLLKLTISISITFLSLIYLFPQSLPLGPNRPGEASCFWSHFPIFQPKSSHTLQFWQSFKNSFPYSKTQNRGFIAYRPKNTVLILRLSSIHPQNSFKPFFLWFQRPPSLLSWAGFLDIHTLSCEIKLCQPNSFWEPTLANSGFPEPKALLITSNLVLFSNCFTYKCGNPTSLNRL